MLSCDDAAWVFTPGLPAGGDRAAEFALRLRGVIVVPCDSDIVPVWPVCRGGGRKEIPSFGEINFEPGQERVVVII